MKEKALIQKCKRGERQAFDELIRLYYDYVSGFLLKATANAALSENLTQEAFLKMIRNIVKFDPGGSAALWHLAYHDRQKLLYRSSAPKPYRA